MALYANGLAGYRLRWEPTPRSRCADANTRIDRSVWPDLSGIGQTLHLHYVWLQGHR